MKRRIFAMVLAAVMLLPTVLASAAFGDVTEETPYAEEIAILEALGVVTGDENNDFDPDGELLRADFAMMVGTILGYDKTPAAEQVFSDVPQDHYAAGVIAALHGSGVLSGVGGGLFEPDSSVTFAQAAKVLVSITGYQQLAQAQGGYPTGYIIQASTIGISSDMPQDQPLTRAQAAHLIYQALRADLRQQVVYDNDYPQYEIIRGETLLTNVMQVYMLRNVVVNDTYKTSSQLQEQQVKIGGVIYNTGETNAADFIGQGVTIYYKIDETLPEELVLLYINTMPQSSEVVIPADDIISYENNTLRYVEDGRTTSTYIGRDANIMYNGRSVVYDSSLFQVQNGSIRLSNSDGGGTYNLVEIESYENILIGGIDYENQVIYDRYDRSLMVQVPDDQSAVCEVRLPGDETIFSFEDLSEGMLVSVYESQDGQYIKIVIGGDPITATVTEISDDQIKLGETWYEKAPSLDRMPAIELGGTYTFFQDIDNRIAARSSDVASQQYGFVIELGAKNGGMDTEMQVMLLNAEGEVAVMDLAASMNLNGTSIKSGSEDGRNALLSALKSDGNVDSSSAVYTPGGIISQLVTYQVNAAGEINELRTAKVGQEPYEFSLDFAKSSQQYKSGRKTFRMKFMAGTNTKIFMVSPDGSIDEEDFDSVDSSRLQNDRTYQVAAYDVDDGGAAAAIVIWENTGGETTNDSAFGVVDKVVSAVKEDGSATQKLYAIANGKYVELLTDEMGTLQVQSGDGMRQVQRGDGIIYETNRQGEISKVTLEFDVTRPYSPQQKNSVFNYLWTMYGTVYSKEGNNFIMTSNVAEQIDDSLFENRDAWISFTAAGNIYIYDAKEDEVNRATADEIYTYMMSGENASRIYVRFRYESVRDILIYKD